MKFRFFRWVPFLSPRRRSAQRGFLTKNKCELRGSHELHESPQTGLNREHLLRGPESHQRLTSGPQPSWGGVGMQWGGDKLQSQGGAGRGSREAGLGRAGPRTCRPPGPNPRSPGPSAPAAGGRAPVPPPARPPAPTPTPETDTYRMAFSRLSPMARGRRPAAAPPAPRASSR